MGGPMGRMGSDFFEWVSDMPGASIGFALSDDEV
jgi:hypothetical protein